MFLLGLGAALSVVQTNHRNRGAVSPFDSIVRLLVSPVSTVVRNTHSGFSNLSFGILNADRLVRENADLKRQLTSLGMYTETVDLLRDEVDALRKLQGLTKTYQRRHVAAEVRGFFPLENRLTINQGKSSGLVVGAPVLSGIGLVGVVQTVSMYESQVRLLNSVGPSIGAIAINHNPPLAGILKGDTPFPSILFADPAAPVQMNDPVTTSGWSARIPRGILIGKVVQIVDSAETGSRKAMVNLAVDVSRVREVVVLL